MVKIKFKAKLRKREFKGRKVYEITIPKLLVDFFELENHIGKTCLVTLKTLEGDNYE